MKVTVIKEFQGVENGAIYPRAYVVGETVEGRLADVALAEGWGEEIITGTKEPGEGGAVQIPENWREFNAADTVALATALGAVDIKTKAPAVEFVEAEIERRLAAQV